jgi:hypothetical protein
VISKLLKRRSKSLKDINYLPLLDTNHGADNVSIRSYEPPNEDETESEPSSDEGSESIVSEPTVSPGSSLYLRLVASDGKVKAAELKARA